MISADGEWIVCDEDGCNARAKNHRWGKVKAEGWFFFRRDGLEDAAYCPEHVPAWVEKWRAWRAERKAK